MEQFIRDHREELERCFFALPPIVKLCMVLPTTPIRDWPNVMSVLTGDSQFLRYRSASALFEAADTWLMAGGNAFGECDDDAREAQFWMDDDDTTVRMLAPRLADVPDDMIRCCACGRIWDGCAQCSCPESDVSFF